MKLVRGALTASAAGNAVMSGLMGACSTATDSDAAWALYQDACSYGYMLDDHAQQVLWDLQSGSRHLQVFSPTCACFTLSRSTTANKLPSYTQSQVHLESHWLLNTSSSCIIPYCTVMTWLAFEEFL